MSAESAKKHRHDVGHPDHAPETTAEVTRGIQGVLGLSIIATLALALWALWIAL